MEINKTLVDGAHWFLGASSNFLQTGWNHLQNASRKKPAPLIWPVWEPLPVAGIDAISGQSILYSLRSLLPEEATSIDVWLQALQISQLASDMLLESLWSAQSNLNFWRSRLKAGSHGSFMLLERGPVGFVTDVLDKLKLRGAHEGSRVAASDRIEERVVALQLLSTQLAEALAEVHHAAALLQLKGTNFTAAAAAAVARPQQTAAVQQLLQAAVLQCLSRISHAVEQLTAQAIALQQHNTAAKTLHSAAMQQPLAGSILHSTDSSSSTPAAAQSQPSQSPTAAASLQQLQELLARVQQQLNTHKSDLANSRSSGDVGAALAAASLLAAQLGSLVPIPQWALMPSRFQRHWIKYTIAAGLSVSAGVYLYKHSRLAGSRDLDDWAAAAVTAAKGAWSDHVVTPLLVVRDELFNTFRSRPSIVSTGEFQADKESLLRMLAEFQRDHPAAAAAAAAIHNTTPASSGSSSSSNGATSHTTFSPSSSGGHSSGGNSSGSSSSDGGGVVTEVDRMLDSDAVNVGMQVVMRCYENDLKHPIKNLITGELARTLLIQVQRLKLDTEAAMLELDQILRANELSISLVAAVPALLISWTLVRGLWVLLLVRQPPDPRRQALPCRMAMAEVERALAALASKQQLQHQAALPDLSVGQANCVAAAAATTAAEGLVLYKLFRVYREAQRLYRLKDKSSKFSEWPHLQADLMELVQTDVPASSKLDLHARMLRTYTLLQP